MEENKRNKKYGFLLSYWAWMLLVKSGGAKEVKICFGTQVSFLIFHDKQKLGIWGNRALKVRRTENIAQKVQSC